MTLPRAARAFIVVVATAVGFWPAQASFIEIPKGAVTNFIPAAAIDEVAACVVNANCGVRTIPEAAEACADHLMECAAKVGPSDLFRFVSACIIGPLELRAAACPDAISSDRCVTSTDSPESKSSRRWRAASPWNVAWAASAAARPPSHNDQFIETPASQESSHRSALGKMRGFGRA